MTSEFRKLLSKEFGVDEYNAYFDYTNRMFQRERTHRKEAKSMMLKEEMILKTLVFRNMEVILNHKTKRQLNLCSERLLECMKMTMDIHRYFVFVFLSYLASAFVLIGLSLNPVVSVFAMVVLTICFLYKTIEYIVNKYCYIDAYLIMIYKNVLQKLLQG